MSISPNTTEPAGIESRIERLAYSFDDAALALGIPRNTIRDAHSRGEFHAKRVGKRWMVLRKELERWLSE